MNKEKKIPGHILSLFIILLSISGVCLLMYKAQFRDVYKRQDLRLSASLLLRLPLPVCCLSTK